MSRSRRRTAGKSDADFTLDLICGRWKASILMELRRGPQRTGKLVRALQGVSKNRLNDALRELRRSGIIRRRVYPGPVPRVEHELTALGKTLCPIVNDLHAWGLRSRRKVVSARAARRQ
ncbi:MAG TPA: helix-turn-helix domain-containing protein [Elusimicrobiota bacterium]|nr:helix-turn-helix domain-containing protein [Elusimicrobiota bacterium]